MRLTPCISKRKSVSDTIVPAPLWGGLSLLSGILSINARSAFEALPIMRVVLVGMLDCIMCNLVKGA